MPNPFWSAEDNRMRALWRIMMQLILFLLLLLLLSTPVMMLLNVSPENLQQSAVLSPNIISTALALTFAISMTFCLWVMARFVDKRSFAEYGFHMGRVWWLDLLFGLGLGVLLMALVFGVQLLFGWVQITGTFAAPTDTGFILALLLMMIQFACVGIYEEMFSRGYHILNLAEGFSFLGNRWGVLLAYLISSVIFGVLHAQNPNITALALVNLAAAGLLMGLPYILTGNLGISIGFHISWNFAQGNIFGFPVSGSSVNEVSLIAVNQAGPELWTGGAFGPEGGLLVLLSLLLGAGLVVLWVRRQYGSTALETALAQYSKPEDEQNQ